jgi:hypothetical protein
MNPRIKPSPTPPLASLSAAILAASLAAMMPSGCVAQRSGAPRVNKPVMGSGEFSRTEVSQKINADDLDRLTNAYADRFRTLMEDAVGSIVAGNPDAQQRAAAQGLLAVSTTSVYDIATNGDPFTQMLDLTVTVTLTSQVWIDRDRAVMVFGEERAQPLIASLRQARKEVWEISQRVFTQEQLTALDFLITAWRKQNPHVDDVAFVRFNDFIEGHADSVVADAAGGGGLFEPIGRAVDQARSYERLLERIFYISKRAPVLFSWQSQAAIDGLLARPEVVRTIGNIDATAANANKFVGEIPELIAREREAVFAGIDARMQQADGTLSKVQGVVDATAPIVKDVNRLAETADRMMDKAIVLAGPARTPDPAAPPSKPFDVADYQKLLAEASVTLREANELASKGESLAGSPAIKGLIDEVTKATEERIASVEEAASRVIWRATGAVALIAVLSFGLALAYRALSRQGNT